MSVLAAEHTTIRKQDAPPLKLAGRAVTRFELIGMSPLPPERDILTRHVMDEDVTEHPRHLPDSHPRKIAWREAQSAAEKGKPRTDAYPKEPRRPTYGERWCRCCRQRFTPTSSCGKDCSTCRARVPAELRASPWRVRSYDLTLVKVHGIRAARREASA